MQVGDGAEMSGIVDKIEQYNEYLDSCYSPNTVQAYHRDVLDYCSFLIGYLGDENPEIIELNRLSVRHYIASLHRDGKSSSTIHRRIASLSSFFEFLRRRGIVENNPARGLARPKLQQGLPPFIEEKALGRILDSLPDETKVEIRDRAMIELFYGAGLRLAELIQLKLRDFEGGGFIRVIGKGSKERIIPIGKRAAEALENYLQIRKQLLNNENHDYLFLNNRGNKLDRRYVQRRIKQLLNSISNDISPHDLRHAFATHMMRNGADLRAIQELLGHANLTATQIYTHLCPSDLKKIYSQTHPRA